MTGGAVMDRTLGGKPRGYVLLVEDNPHDEALALRALGKAGLSDRVVVKRDGEEAIEFLRAACRPGSVEGAGPPAVVLLDLKLPKVDGKQVLAAIRADPATALIPVVVMTSSDEPRDLRECYRAGANSYLRKPVEFADFNEAIRLVGLYWLGLNEPVPRTGAQ